MSLFLAEQDSLADLLHTVKSAPTTLGRLQRNTYETLLSRHDWGFRFSDDARVYGRGRAQRVELEMLRKELDQDYFVWNEFAPADCLDGAGAM